MEDMVLCLNPDCSMGDFDAVGEKNRCPLCDTLVGGSKCVVCEFVGMDEIGGIECSYPIACPEGLLREEEK